MRVTRSVLDYVARLPPRSHAIMCYEDAETVSQIFTAFVDGSAEKNEAVQILCSSRNTYDAFLQSANLSPPARDRVQCLAMSEYSSKSAGVNLEKALSLIKSAQATSKLGFSGLRIFSLSNEYFDHTSPHEVVRFEQQLGRDFPLPMAMLCAYNTASNLSDELLLDLLRAHGSHIFQGIAG